MDDGSSEDASPKLSRFAQLKEKINIFKAPQSPIQETIEVDLAKKKERADRKTLAKFETELLVDTIGFFGHYPKSEVLSIARQRLTSFGLSDKDLLVEVIENLLQNTASSTSAEALVVLYPFYEQYIKTNIPDNSTREQMQLALRNGDMPTISVLTDGVFGASRGGPGVQENWLFQQGGLRGFLASDQNKRAANEIIRSACGLVKNYTNRSSSVSSPA